MILYNVFRSLIRPMLMFTIILNYQIYRINAELCPSYRDLGRTNSQNLERAQLTGLGRAMHW